MSAKALPSSSAGARQWLPRAQRAAVSRRPGPARPMAMTTTAGSGDPPSSLQKNTAQQVVFEPYKEVAGELTTVSKVNELDTSFARCNYADTAEAAINEQINIEYNISHVYNSLYAFFDRDNVGLPGLAEHFRKASQEEKEHAEKLLAHQNVRGGRVRLGGILAPEVEYNHDDKGDALYAMELALSLEKLNFQKLRALHDVAAAANDAELCDFIEGELLQEQALAVKQAAVYVSQLRRVGKGLGVFEFDRYLQQNGGDLANVIGTVAAATLAPA